MTKRSGTTPPTRGNQKPQQPSGGGAFKGAVFECGNAYCYTLKNGTIMQVSTFRIVAKEVLRLPSGDIVVVDIVTVGGKVEFPRFCGHLT